MDSYNRRRLAMAVRVLDFAHQHPSTDTSFTGLVKRLEESVTRLEALSVEENAGLASASAAGTTRRKARRTMLRKLQHLAQVAKLVELDQPLTQSFVAPRSGAPLHVISTIARRMLASATEQQELFMKYGLGETFLDGFAAALTTFDAATLGLHSSRGQHVGAGAELEVLGSECTMVIRALEGIVRDVYDGDANILRAWDSARNVVGPFHRTPPTPGPNDTKAA